MLSFLSLMLRRKKTIITAAVIGFAAAAVISLVLPKKYISRAAFIPGGVEQELTGRGSFLSRLGILSQSYATLIRVSRNFIIDYIVRSNRMAIMMDERFDLKGMYGTDSDIKMRQKLSERTFVNVRDEGVIEVAVEAPEAELARDMVAAYIEFIDSILVDLNIRNAETKVRYLEKELRRLERETAERDSAISAFMASAGVFEIEQQARAAIEMIGAFKARISILEVERSIMSVDLREGSHDLERIDLEIEKMKAEVKKAMENRDGGGIFPPLSEIPTLAATYLGMESERMAGEFSMAYIRLKLEDAKISTALDISVLRVIDPPVVPDRRAWPKRKQIVIILTLATVFWTCFVITLKERLFSDADKARREEDIAR